MARVNEYKAKGGSFDDAKDALSVLESYLDEIKVTLDESTTKIDKERKYRSNISGLKGCFTGTIENSVPRWQELGLDTSFVQEVEEIHKERFVKRLMFRHPVYEHIWLTDIDGGNVDAEMLPFLVLEIEYFKANDAVNITVERVDTKLNLPEMKTSIRGASEDIENVKREAELVGTVLGCASDIELGITTSLESYCSARKLKWESSSSAIDTFSSSNKKNKKETKDDASYADVEEIEIGDSDFTMSDIDSTFPDDVTVTASTSKKKGKISKAPKGMKAKSP